MFAISVSAVVKRVELTHFVPSYDNTLPFVADVIVTSARSPTPLTKLGRTIMKPSLPPPVDGLATAEIEPLNPVVGFVELNAPGVVVDKYKIGVVNALVFRLRT